MNPANYTRFYTTAETVGTYAYLLFAPRHTVLVRSRRYTLNRNRAKLPLSFLAPTPSIRQPHHRRQIRQERIGEEAALLSIICSAGHHHENLRFGRDRTERWSRSVEPVEAPLKAYTGADGNGHVADETPQYNVAMCSRATGNAAETHLVHTSYFSPTTHVTRPPLTWPSRSRACSK